LSFSQSNTSEEISKIKLGFYLGLNYSNLTEDEKLPVNTSISNNLGFSLGVLADFRVSKMFSISPKGSVSFYGSKINSIDQNNSNIESEVIPASIDFRTHFVFKKDNEKLSPYFLIGPSINIDNSNKETYPMHLRANNNLAIDFGIGVEKPFTHFSIIPEFRYSYGLNNISTDDSIPSLRFHYFSLVLNFF
tara:strand:+ start:190 stop:762 length:573 start_codon:yes stop_codon:yes gene_type:complete